MPPAFLSWASGVGTGINRKSPPSRLPSPTCPFTVLLNRGYLMISTFSKVLLAAWMAVQIHAVPNDPVTAAMAKTAQIYYQSQTVGDLATKGASVVDASTLQFLKDKAKGHESMKLPKMVIHGTEMVWPDTHPQIKIDFAGIDKNQFRLNKHVVICKTVTPAAVC
jgi:hypothetical protein